MGCGGSGGCRCGEIPPPDLDGGEEQAVHDVCAGSKVVHALGEPEVAGVEDGGAGPADEAHVAKEPVVPVQRVRAGDLAVQRNKAEHVGVQVRQAEHDGEGLLHAQRASERPFAVELLDTFGRSACQPRCRHTTLARVVALGRARPQQQPQVQRQNNRVVGAVPVDAHLLPSVRPSIRPLSIDEKGKVKSEKKKKKKKESIGESRQRGG